MKTTEPALADIVEACWRQVPSERPTFMELLEIMEGARTAVSSGRTDAGPGVEGAGAESGGETKKSEIRVPALARQKTSEELDLDAQMNLLMKSSGRKGEV